MNEVEQMSKHISETVEALDIDPKFLLGLSHKADNVRCIWWYSLITGEFRSSTNPKDTHHTETFKDISYKSKWIRGRVAEYKGKLFLVVYM